MAVKAAIFRIQGERKVEFKESLIGQIEQGSICISHDLSAAVEVGIEAVKRLIAADRQMG